MKKSFSGNVGTILQENINEDIFYSKETTKQIKNAKQVEVNLITPDPDQPRSSFDDKSIKALASSINEIGIIQPIIVHKVSEGSYIIIAGERRYRAAKLLNLSDIPCIIYKNIDINKKTALQIVENLQREDLNPIDKAKSLIRFKNKLASWDAVERLTGISKRRRQQYTSILKLEENLQDKIIEMISFNKVKFNEIHARALLSLKKFPEKQHELLSIIENQKLTGNAAMDKAKESIGNKTKQITLSYESEDELLKKLHKLIKKLSKQKRT